MTDVKAMVDKQREFFYTGVTLSVDWRIEQIKKLRQVIINNEKDILNALHEDLNKCDFEGYVTEVGIVLEEIKYVLKNIRRWARPRQVKTPLTHFPSESKIYYEPYGVVLVMSPWNYPFQLAINPLVGAMAAGNCAILKPSNYSPATSNIMAKLISENFDEAYINTVLGGREANKNLLEEKFDYIFFTGSVAVGKTVMEAASKHLTPVSLELGGKSPCIVDKTAKLKHAARRIVWGKYLNSGQTCVAPDYVLVHKDVKDELITLMKAEIEKMHGQDCHCNPQFPRIINQKHFERLQGLMKSGKIVEGGMTNAQTLQIAPTILDEVSWQDPVMCEEIFGPLMPILTFENLSEVVDTVRAHPKPLALYFFTESKDNEKYILRNISFGGGCINDTIVHLATSHMPFGGVGESGMGGYHGESSFETFSHQKSILKKSTKLDLPMRYPPAKDSNYKLIKKIMC